MKLDNFRLLINDFSASFQFWRDVIGLELIFTDEQGTYAYFQAGDTRLELLKADYFAIALGDAPPTQGNYRGVVVFKSDDVDATYADLVKRGAPSLAPPQDRPEWRCRTAHLSAPDGYLVEIFTSLRDLSQNTEN